MPISGVRGKVGLEKESDDIRGGFLTVVNIFSRLGKIKAVKFSSVWRGFQIG
jgi:hypothetical protein